MHLRTLIILAILSFHSMLSAQDKLNIELVSHLPFDNDASDVWGYVDSTGREYAIIGLNTYTAVVSLEDPTNPEELVRIPGARSIWRDMKSHGNFVYVVADQGADGVLIIDMSYAPDSISWNFWQPELDTLGISNTLQRCHNLYIDEAGFAFLSGCNVNGGGVIILDVFSDPKAPRLVGVCDRRYSHDNFSRGDTVWSGDINDGVFSAIDVSDKGNPVTLATQATSRNFAHNTWLSDDGKYLFTTDERPDANVDAYDVSDLNDIRRLDTYRPKAHIQRGVIPHNTHYFKGYLVTSWYTDGVIITDVHKPDNMVEVGFFDSYPGADGGFNGAWGAYPFLPSGLLLVSDIQTGLYVLEPEYQRASYLEGKVTDANTGNPVIGANLNIESPLFSPIVSDLQGDYKTGLATSGSFEVIVDHPEYQPALSTVTLVEGEVTVQNFALVPKRKVSLGGNVRQLGTGISVMDAHVVVANNEVRFETVTDANGSFTLELLEGTYDVYIAAWGYLHLAAIGQDFITDERRSFELEKGYQDDFFADLGWQVTSTASAGLWERDIPEGTLLGTVTANPDQDVQGDFGNQCYVTGNDGRGEAGRDDIDNGYTMLSSPAMQLASYREPLIEFAYWYVVGGGRTMPNDTFQVLLTNGIGDTAVILETAELSPRWKLSGKIRVSDYLVATDDVRIHFLASDDVAEGHVVEAGIDLFSVTEGNPTGIRQTNENIVIEIGPNPFYSGFFISFQTGNNNAEWNYQLLDEKGTAIMTGSSINPEIFISAEHLPAGKYFIQMNDGSGYRETRKVIKAQ